MLVVCLAGTEGEAQHIAAGSVKDPLNGVFGLCNIIKGVNLLRLSRILLPLILQEYK